MKIEWDVPIEMDDGVVLRADVFRPIAEGHYPVIMTHGPYGKGLAFQEGYKEFWEILVKRFPSIPRESSCKYLNWEVVDPEMWVKDGYVCIRIDSRGAGRSKGKIDVFSRRETQDFFHCIEWAGIQPWSNGKVGLNGISYYAINQWQVAALKPKYLTAMCVWEGAGDYYRDMNFHGGIPCDFNRIDSVWYAPQIQRVQHGYGDRGYKNHITQELVSGPETLSDTELVMNRTDLCADMKAHLFYDDWHKTRSACWDKIEVPFLSCANWGGQGNHPRGNFEGFLQAK